MLGHDAPRPGAAASLQAAGLFLAAAAGAAVAVAPELAWAVAVLVAGALVVVRYGVAGCLASACLLVWTTGSADAYLDAQGLWAAVAAALIVLSFAAVVLRARQERPGIGLLELALLGFLAAVVFWSAQTALHHREQAVAGFRVWVFFVLLFVVGRDMVRRHGELERWAAIMPAVVLVPLLYGVKQFLVGYTPEEAALIDQEAFTTYWQGLPRIASTLPSPQDFAALLIFALPIAVGFAVEARLPRRATAFAATIAGLCVVLAALGMVRSAGIGALVGALVTLMVSRGRWTRRASVVTAAVAALVVFSMAVLTSTGTREATVRARLETLLAPSEDPAFRARLDREWPRLLREIRERPFGHGVATTNGPAFEVSRGHVANATDNGYLTLAYELGIPGLVAYVLLLLATAVAAARTGRRPVSPVVRAVCRGGAGAIAGLMVAMLAGSYIQLGTVQILLFTLIGIVSSARWLRSAGPS